MKKEYDYKTNERADYSDINCHAWKGSVVNEHAHRDYYEIIITTGGDLENTVGNETFMQRERDVLILSPGSFHKICCTEVGAHYNIAVRAECFERLISGKTAVKNALKEKGFLTVTLNESEYEYIKDYIEKIENGISPSYSYTIAETVISVIFIAVMDKALPDEGSREAAAYYCRDAIKKIENGSLSDKNASEIYKSYPVSHSAFIAEFKRITGKNPSDYLKESKLYRAKNLLLTTSSSVLDISYEVGYDSVSHFIKCFKKKYGVTPHKYRNENKK